MGTSKSVPTGSLKNNMQIIPLDIDRLLMSRIWVKSWGDVRMNKTAAAALRLLHHSVYTDSQ